MNDDIFGRLKAVTVETLDIDPERVTKDTIIFDTPTKIGLTGHHLECVKLFVAFQEEFGLRLRHKASEKLLTLGQLTDYIEANLPSGQPEVSSIENEVPIRDDPAFRTGTSGSMATIK
jgi:acyl carrier protein